MKKRAQLFRRPVAALAAAFVTTPLVAGATSDSLRIVAEANGAFAVDLYGRLRESPGNLFYSPYSIATALAMTYAGARGETAAEMAAVLRLPADSEVHTAFGRLIQHLAAIQAGGQVQLRVANSLWPHIDYPFRPGYLDLVRHSYQAQIQPLDFGQPRQATETINLWVEEKTEQRIQDLIPDGALDSQTRLVLANAIYFKGDWQSPFSKTATGPAAFDRRPGDPVQVPMMYQQSHHGYREDDDAQWLDLTYAGRALSMWIVLPKERFGLDALEASLVANPNRIGSPAQWTRREVKVFLPRFKLTSAFSLPQTLRAMGMTRAFDSRQADFSGMGGEPGALSISEVRHKAFVDVNEEGTEAAAATAVGVRATAFDPRPQPVFRADHPFLFLIRDNQSGTILFLGRCADPTAG